MNRETIKKLIERIKTIEGLHNEDGQRLAEVLGFLAGLLETPPTGEIEK